MISYGIDIGTTTLRAIAVDIQIGSFGQRSFKTIGDPLCVFTPFTEARSLDEKAILGHLKNWVKLNCLLPAEVGSLLFTGEAQRAVNSVAVGERLTQEWEGVLSAQLNPDLESRIAAFGSGAVTLSAAQLGKPVVHIDIGGGTSNFAWIENGQITDTACLNLGCRKWIFDSKTHQIEHQTKEGKLLADLVKSSDPKAVCNRMVEFLMRFAKGETTAELEPFIVLPWRKSHTDNDHPILSVSGGVVECEGETNDYRFGDLGVFFLKSLKAAEKDIRFSTQQGKATALGVSTFGFQVSGGSIFKSPLFPTAIKNIPLYDENEFLKIKTGQRCCAISVPFQATEATAIEAYAKRWGMLLRERCTRDAHVVFLFPKNIAKTFGYFLTKSTSDLPEILVLDEIHPEISRTQLRTLDLVFSAEAQRYLVTLKSLFLFGGE